MLSAKSCFTNEVGTEFAMSLCGECFTRRSERNPMTTATRTLLVGVFDDRYQAEQAVDDLEQAGFAHDDIGFALRGEDVTRGGMVTDAVGTKDDTGAATGAVTGGVVGGLLGAAAAMIIPGI